jgi:hypothetical protein
MRPSTIIEQEPEKDSAYEARFTAAAKGPIRLSLGLEIVANNSINDNTMADILLVPSSSGVSKVIGDTAFIEYILKRSRQWKKILVRQLR